MDKDRVHAALEGMLETLASIEHERWSHWQRYMHSKGKLQPDGFMLIPADLTLRWASQMTKPYSALTDTEKESDREQVRKYLGHIRDAMSALVR
jgi:hypothetical protein